MNTPPLRPKNRRESVGNYSVGTDSVYESEDDPSDVLLTPTTHSSHQRSKTPAREFLSRAHSEHNSTFGAEEEEMQTSQDIIQMNRAEKASMPATEPKKQRGFLSSIFKFGDNMSESSYDPSIASRPTPFAPLTLTSPLPTRRTTTVPASDSKPKSIAKHRGSSSRPPRTAFGAFMKAIGVDDSASDISVATTATTATLGSNYPANASSDERYAYIHSTPTMARTSSGNVVSGNPFGKVMVSPGDGNSGIRSGTVANVIAKFAQEEAEQKQRQKTNAQPHANARADDDQDEEAPREHYLRILGPYARDPSQWRSEEEMRREVEEYDNTVDPELLIVEALLIDAQNTLNILVHEFLSYSDSYVQLGSNATILSRVIHNVVVALERRGKRERRQQQRVASRLAAQADEDEDSHWEDSGSDGADSDDDGDDDTWGLCDADGVPLQLSQAQVQRAGKELSTRTKFIRTQTRLGQHIYRIFSSEYKGDLRDLALSWKDRYLSLENELLRAEHHFMQRRKATNRLKALQSTYSRAREQVKPALQAQIEDIEGTVHEHTTLYQGIMQDLRNSLAGESGLDASVDKLLELTLSSQLNLFKSVLGNDGQSVLAKVTSASTKMRARAATKAADFFLNKRPAAAAGDKFTSPLAARTHKATSPEGIARTFKSPLRVDVAEPEIKQGSRPTTPGSRKSNKDASFGGMSAAAAAIKAAMAKRLNPDAETATDTAVSTPVKTVAVALPAVKTGNIPPAPSLESLGMTPPSNIPPVPPGLLEEVLREFGGSSSSGSKIPRVPNLAGLFGAAKTPAKTRQELDAEIVEKLGITPIPKADVLWQPAHAHAVKIGSGGENMAPKVWHWESVDVKRLEDTIWRDVSLLLDPHKVAEEYESLTSDPPEENECVTEEEEDEFGNIVLVQREVKKKIPGQEIPDLHFGLLTEQDVVDMALLFSQQKVTKKVAAKPDTKAKVETVSLLDGKRAHALNISLGQLRMDYYDLIYNIYSLNDEFPTEKVHVLLNMLPTADEMKELRSYRGDTALLGNAEKFYLAIVKAEDQLKLMSGSEAVKSAGPGGNMSHFEKCVRAMMFMRDFGNFIRTLSDQLDTVCNALMGLRDSPQTKLLLLAALSIGNLLNSYHTSRSAGYGFKLGDLRKISGIKANMNILDKRDARAAKQQDEQDQGISRSASQTEETGEELAEGADEVDGSEVLHDDFTEYPMPKQANLAHFLVKLLIRRDPYLCPSLEIAAEAYSIASKIEQNTLSNDVNHIQAQMRQVNSLFGSLTDNIEKYSQIFAQYGGEVDEAYNVVKVGNPYSDNIESAVALSLMSSYNKLQNFIAYATLRVTEVLETYEIGIALIAELSVLFYEADAKEAWELLFSTWSDYLRMLSVAYDEIMTEKAKRKQVRTRKMAALELRRKRQMQTQRDT